jgi:hypothetical protein
MADLTAEQQAFLDGPDGAQMDTNLSSGIVFSNKTITKQGSDSFSVFHAIDGSWTSFTRKGMVEVFTGERDIWDGDIPEDEPDPESDNDAAAERIYELGIELTHLLNCHLSDAQMEYFWALWAGQTPDAIKHDISDLSDCFSAALDYNPKENA